MMLNFANAAAATDAAVQELIAKRDIAWRNGDNTSADAITTQLNTLGYQ